MRTFLLLAVALLLAGPRLSGQSLAEVLGSVQERKRAVEQSAQVAQHLPSVDESAVTVDDQELLEWSGLEGTDFPTSQQVDGLGIDGKVALLNQAAGEFRKLQKHYVNLRREDLVGGKTIGVIRAFLPEDFPDPGRADEANYHEFLAALARDVRRLAVLPWPVGGKERKKRYWLDNVQHEVYDENYVMTDIETVRSGTETMMKWLPSALGGGDVLAGIESWEFTTISQTGAWGSFLDETLVWNALSDTDQFEDIDYGPYELSHLNVTKDTNFHSQAALFSKVPGRDDQIDGTVALLARNEWSPVDMTHVAVTAPDSWDPGEAGFEVLLAAEDPAGITPLGSDPEIVVDLDWVVLGTPRAPSDSVWHDGIPLGYAGTKTWLKGPADSTDPNWLLTWEYQQGIAPDGIAEEDITLFRRKLCGLFAPTFAEGLDGDDKPGKLTEAEKFAAPPAGDGMPVLHPVPGVLIGIPVGVGIDGTTTGFVGISPCESGYCGESGVIYPRSSQNRLVTRFDYAANLRFIGPAQDFHVVYATGRDAAARGGGLPATGPTTTETAATGGVSFFDAWDVPRLQQVVSRDLLIDIEPMGHFKNQVRVFRRALDDGPVDRAPGEIADLPSGAPIRTLIFENTDIAGEPYPATPEKVQVTDGATVYQVWRDGYPVTGAAPDPAMHFSMMDGATERFSKSIAFSAGGQATIATAFDEVAAPVATLADAAWDWWGGKIPASIAFAAGQQTATVANTFDTAAPGSQDGRYPQTSTITLPDEPVVTLEWMAGGVLKKAVRGPWSLERTPDGNGLKTATKLGAAGISTVWTEWSDQQGTVLTWSAPNGAVSSKTDSSVLLTELKYGDTAGTGLPGLPHRLLRKNGAGQSNGSGIVWSWTVEADGATSVETADGLLSGEAVGRGFKSVIRINERGYVTATENFLIQGSALQLSGSAAPAGQFTAWGAPVKFTDHTSGLATTLAYDGPRERVASATDAFGNVTTFKTYDALDRPTVFKWKTYLGSASYNDGGFGTSATLDIGDREIVRSSTRDAWGRAAAASFTAGGTSGFTLARAAAGDTLTATESVTGATTITKSGPAGGLEKRTGTLLAFGGLDGTDLAADAGFLKSTTTLDQLAARFRTAWTDAWGRTHQTSVPGAAGAAGGAADVTNFLYSTPDSAIDRVEIRPASGLRLLRETEPWSDAGIVTRSGIDKNRNGSLDAGDRYVTATTTIVIGENLIHTVLTRTGDAVPLLVRDYNPANGDTTTVLNGGEETIVENPNFGAKTVKIERLRSGSAVQTTDLTLNHLGQVDKTIIGGTGLAPATIGPTFRDDGSLASLTLATGAAAASVDFAQDGTLAGFTDPLLGTLPVTHGFSNSTETLTANGATATSSLDGAAATLTGAGVIPRATATGIAGGNFKRTITPAAGSPTSRIYNPAGAETLHDYAAGADTGASWYPGGLPATVSLARGGALDFGYTDDGARDLKTITWPTALSAGFPDIPSYGGAIGLIYDNAGRIDRITDESGARDLAYETSRLAATDWTSGELVDYKVARTHDSYGRADTVTIYRNGASIHSFTYGYTGNGDEISGLTSGAFSASYDRNTARQITGIDRGPVTQTRGRGTAGRIESANSNITGAPNFTYSNFDARGRRKSVQTNRGTWFYNYRNGDGGDGQLTSATNGTLNSSFSYQFDAIGRRTEHSNNAGDPLNRFVAIARTPQPKPLFISADPTASLWVNGVEMTPFDGGLTYNLPPPAGANGGWAPWTVKGVLQGAGDPGAFPDAVAELGGNAWFPPNSETLTYDADGNRESGGNWNYGWNGLNRLVRARTKDYKTAPEGIDVGFQYDAEGRRFRKTVTRYQNGAAVEQTKITFVWDGWNLIYERHERPNGLLLLERKYIWGPDIANGAAGGAGGLLLIRETRGQETKDYYPLYDGAGHLTALIDATGQKAAEYWYGPFGELIETKGELSAANPFRYATIYHDQETGLYYFGQRYYDPATAQWLNREPLGESESLNLYAYCHNDPINMVDILGLAPKWLTAEQSVIYDKLASETIRASIQAGAVNPHMEADILNNMRQDGYISGYNSANEARLDAYYGTVGKVARENPNYISAGGVISSMIAGAIHIIPGNGPQGSGASDGSNTTGMLLFDTFRLNANSLVALGNPGSATIQGELSGFVAGYNKKYFYRQRTYAEAGTLLAAFLLPEAAPRFGEAFSSLKGSRFSEALNPTLAGRPAWASGMVSNPVTSAAKGGTTTLWRSVSEAELRDVAASGMLRPSVGAMGAKWFAENASDAAAWGRKFYAFDKEPVFTLKIDVLDNIANQMMRMERLDGIGAARSADGALLDMINQQGTIKALNGSVLPR